MTDPAPREGWRRAVHLASGALGLVALQLPNGAAAALFGALVLLAGLLEAARLASPRVAEALWRLAGPLFRPAESHGVSGATFLATGYALAWGLFPPRAAAAGILAAAAADPAAALVGSRFAPKGSGKTWAGTVAAAAVAAVVLVEMAFPPAAVVAGAAAAALAERTPWRGSDNLAVPVLTAAALAALG